MATRTLEELKQDFLEYIALEREQSDKTVENYDHYLSRFLARTHLTSPRGITEARINTYRTWLEAQESAQGGTLSAKTVNYHLTALRAFLKYLHTLHITTLDPSRIKLARVSYQAPEACARDDLRRLLHAVDGKDLKSLRDRAILYTLTSTGLRISDLCALDADIDLTKSSINVSHGSTSAQTVPLSGEARRALRSWLRARHDNEAALFTIIGPRAIEGDNRLSPRSVQRIVKQYATKAGITRTLTPQTLRRK